jgi:gluconokinase
MGVAGVGKSTFGAALAAELGVPFIEGDTFHPAENVSKMAAGTPLQDADRWSWLQAIGQAVAAQRQARGVVASCSALKRSYRDRLRAVIGAPLLFVCLVAERERLAARMLARKDHYMPAALLDSQLQALELPAADEQAVLLDAERSVESMLAELRAQPGIGLNRSR